MIDVPDHLMRELLEGHEIVAKIDPVEPQNRAWVTLCMGKGSLFDPIDAPNRPPHFLVYRFDIDKTIVEDEMSGPNDADHFEHIESFKYEDIGEAVAKALTYEPDWSKWGRLCDDPDCP